MLKPYLIYYIIKRERSEAELIPLTDTINSNIKMIFSSLLRLSLLYYILSDLATAFQLFPAKKPPEKQVVF